MKYHICREKMQLSRAKPGNPASKSYAQIIMAATHHRFHYIAAGDVGL